MATDSATPGEYLTGNRRHRRILYRALMRRPFRHDLDTDIIDGTYRDTEGEPLGRLIAAESPPPLDRFVVLPHEQIPLVHVESALEADGRVSGYEQVFGLLYDPAETPSQGVRDTGDRWESGDLVVYTFETDEEALVAQG
ncbi:MAG: hypothetical protein M9925_05670 [Chloroflexi bacterium]|nr:hypothetical protein [Chloroflexota bacterium]MCZ7577935.1 hypothetical protein [Dehalococcoidia bacterium]